MPEEKKPQVFLAFDFGMRRIGVAIGQTLTGTATPLPIIPATDGVPSWEKIGMLIQHWEVDAFVVGIPYHMDGSEQEITRAARKFGRKLYGRFKLPVYWADERLTTVEARRQQTEKAQKKLALQEIDSYAAKLILESWLADRSKYLK